MTCKSNVYTPKLPHSYTPFNLKRKISHKYAQMHPFGIFIHIYVLFNIKYEKE